MKKLCYFAVLFLFSVIFISSTQADVTNYGVTIDRRQEGGTFTNYFCTDVWGTGITSINITSPSSNIYSLLYEPSEAQWAFDKAGGSEIFSEFIDGTYVFNVIYNDDSTESFDVDFAGTYPPYPELVSINSANIVWKQWQTPTDPIGIEVGIESEYGDELSDWLPSSGTSYSLPSGFLKDNTLYDINILFLSSSYPNAHKNSELGLTYHHNPIPIPGAFWLLITGLAVIVGIRKRVKT
ncbi:MAG: VPLPA-CTERM sorting domain-containing protein [Proteobacteria bacterium]|nr:VPLPA-CTERM sorting domain-containing protein [Pseudomonadota bacterium]